MGKPPKDFAAQVTVYLGLFASAFGAAWFVHTQTTPLPLEDEWDLLHEWIAADSTWNWVWAHHNEHRYPLAKAIWLGTLKLTGFKFASAQYVSFGLLFSSALMLIWTARGLRGRSHPLDILFPALLLHFGHAFNLQMGYQVGFALFAYCAAGWLWCAGRLAQGGGGGWVVASTLYAALLIPCGGFGVLFTPVVAFWLFYLARRASTMQQTGLRRYCLGVAVLVLLYTVWIVATMPKQVLPGANPLGDPGEFLTGLVGYLASALGCWPAREQMPQWPIVAVSVPLVIGYAIATSTLAMRLDRPDPRRIAYVALLLVIVGSVLVGAGAPRARGAGLVERYTTPSAIGSAAVLLGLLAVGPMRMSRRTSGIAGALGSAVAAGLLYANHGPGLVIAFHNRNSIHELLLDIRAGESPLFLAGRHGGTTGILVGDRLGDELRTLRASGIPPFQMISADPAFHSEALSALPKIDWHHPEADFEARKPAPELALPAPPTGAIGLRLRVTTAKFHGRQRLILRWVDAKTAAAHEWAAYPHYLDAVPLNLTFRLTGTPTQLRLVAGSAIEEIEIDSPEWLIGEIGR